MFEVCALGDALIDFIPVGKTEEGNPIFQMNAGGTVANLVVALSRFGLKTAFIGKVGNDQFGKYLVEQFNKNNVDVTGLRYCNQSKTTLSFVQLDSSGDRSFSFYREPGADTKFSQEDIDYSIIERSKIFHFSSMLLTDEPSRNATHEAIRYAREKGLTICYDINLRKALWKDLSAAKTEILSLIPYANILKASDEEIEFVTNEKDLNKATKMITDMGVSIVIITLGPCGSYYRYCGETGCMSAYDTKVLDTTGAGDAFVGGFLFKLCLKGKRFDELSLEEIEEMIDFSNAAGSMTATKRGGMPAMPTLQEVENCMRQTVKLVI